MKKLEIDTAIMLAKEFVALGKKLTYDSRYRHLPLNTGRHSGDFRRKSMDLTRALADLRKS